MAYKCNKPALKMLSPIFQKMGRNHCSEGPLSMRSPINQQDAEGGMSEAERDAYNKETGGDVKGPQQSGPRHDSYCARSAGIEKCQDPDDNGDCPNDVARRNWGC